MNRFHHRSSRREEDHFYSRTDATFSARASERGKLKSHFATSSWDAFQKNNVTPMWSQIATSSTTAGKHETHKAN